MGGLQNSVSSTVCHGEATFAASLHVAISRPILQRIVFVCGELLSKLTSMLFKDPLSNHCLFLYCCNQNKPDVNVAKATVHYCFQ